jgi:glyoxylase-like metal-dependent hydrolase (beta-lactamase superfamily II)
MITIKIFVFNDFQVNTYILYDKTKECVIIDPGCYSNSEKSELVDFIDKQALKPVKLLNTHCHIDHILGNNFVADKYKIGLEIHKKGDFLLKRARDYALAFGLETDKIIEPVRYLIDGDIVKFGDSELKILYTPGHSNDGVSFVNEKQKFVIVGDTLFKQGIGRTDLTTSNYDALISSVKTKLFELNDDYTVYPGHGPSTSIGFEKNNNPFLKC